VTTDVDATPTAAVGSDAPIVRCDGLVKAFGDRVAVDHVGFDILPGETYGLLGPNGAGKTTIISMIVGLLTIDEGTAVVAGHPVGPGSVEAKAFIGLVPQDIALYPDLTARENLRFFGRLQGIGKKDLGERIAHVLGVVGLADRADDRVEDYSGGMKRRCNIAVGLLHEPRLLILDEPTVGVDPQSRNAILESIEVLGGQGLSVLYTTHYMEEAERLCDRVGILDEGRLVAEGTRKELIDQVGEHAHVRIEASNDLPLLAERCRDLDLVAEATVSSGGVDLTVTDSGRALAPIVDAAEAAGVAITSIDVTEPDLETVFLHLTGKALRD
jgi:ABC-2 type transport system ATP-binding protein